MSIAVKCQCGQRFKAKDALAGRRVKCPVCGVVLQVPGGGGSAAAAGGKAAAAGGKPAAGGSARPKPAAARPQKPAAQPQPAADDPLGLGNDPLAEPFDSLASTSLPGGGAAPSGSSPYMATLAQKPKPKKESGSNQLVLGICIGGGVLLLLLIVGGGAAWLVLGGNDSQAVAEAGAPAATDNSAAAADAADADQERQTETDASADSDSDASAPTAAVSERSVDSTDAADDAEGSSSVDQPVAETRVEVEQTQQAQPKKTRRRTGPVKPRPLLGTRKPPKAFAMAVVDEFTAFLEVGNHVSMNEMIDWYGIFENATFGDDDVDPDFRDGFIYASAERAMGPDGFAGQLAKSIEEGGSYTLLRIHDVGDQRRALFRWIRPKAGFSYHDMVLQEDSFAFVDMYDYTKGELLSDTARRSYLASVASLDPNALGPLAGWEDALVTHFDDYQMMAQASGDQPQATLDAYSKLPEALQADKTMLLLRLVAASKLGSNDLYGQSLRDLRKFHPDDPSVDMLAIQFFARQENAEAAIESVDRLEKTVGGDPYLDVVRYDVYRVTGDVRKARQHARTAVKKDPSLEKYIKPITRRPGRTREA